MKAAKYMPAIICFYPGGYSTKRCYDNRYLIDFVITISIRLQNNVPNFKMEKWGGFSLGKTLRTMSKNHSGLKK
jgi:hypothetical protein